MKLHGSEIIDVIIETKYDTNTTIAIRNLNKGLTLLCAVLWFANSRYF
ncbi:protein of unknown function [Moritella yayanosii]|uniref:Uncharacterized protein n=1 Tax=Moritella yayanosii TaxID=69539 RepID=A0A330LN69_9GAMM|nr:protein of unknown function [Moritella yayanosii]